MTSENDPLPEAPENDSMLLPCPFCGGEAELDHLTDEDDFFVSCNICEVQQIANYRPHAAINNWNKRADALRPAASEGEGWEPSDADIIAVAKKYYRETWGHDWHTQHCTHTQSAIARARQAFEFVLPQLSAALWAYAQRHRSVDAEFAADLETALKGKGFEPQSPSLDRSGEIERLRAIAAKATAILGWGSPLTRAGLMQELRDLLDENHRETATEERNARR